MKRIDAIRAIQSVMEDRHHWENDSAIAPKILDKLEELGMRPPNQHPEYLDPYYAWEVEGEEWEIVE